MSNRLVPRQSGGYYYGRVGDFAIRIEHKRLYRSLWWVAKVTNMVTMEQHQMTHPTLKGAEQMVAEYTSREKEGSC